MSHTEYLKSLTACQESIDFAACFPSLQVAWNSCRRGDWMCWYINRMAWGKEWSCPERRLSVRVACMVARKVTHLVEDDYWEQVEGTLEEFDAWSRGFDFGKNLKERGLALWDIPGEPAKAAAYAVSGGGFGTAVVVANEIATASWNGEGKVPYAHWEKKRKEVLQQMADQIRDMVPTVPMMR